MVRRDVLMSNSRLHIKRPSWNLYVFGQWKCRLVRLSSSLVVVFPVSPTLTS